MTIIKSPFFMSDLYRHPNWNKDATQESTNKEHLGLLENPKNIPTKLKAIFPKETFTIPNYHSGVYVVFFNLTGKVYVGMAKKVLSEIGAHLRKGMFKAFREQVIANGQEIFIYSLFSGQKLNREFLLDQEGRLISLVPQELCLNRLNPRKINYIDAQHSIGTTGPKTKLPVKMELFPIHFRRMVNPLTFYHPNLKNSVYKENVSFVIDRKNQTVVYILMHEKTRRLYIGQSKVPVNRTLTRHVEEIRRHINEIMNGQFPSVCGEAYGRMALDSLATDGEFLFTFVKSAEQMTTSELRSLETCVQKDYASLVENRELIYNNIKSITPSSFNMPKTKDQIVLSKNAAEFFKKPQLRVRKISKNLTAIKDLATVKSHRNRMNNILASLTDKKDLAITTKKIAITQKMAENSTLSLTLDRCEGPIKNLSPELPAYTGLTNPTPYKKTTGIVALINVDTGKVYIHKTTNCFDRKGLVRKQVDQARDVLLNPTLAHKTTGPPYQEMAFDLLCGHFKYYCAVIEMHANKAVSDQIVKDRALQITRDFYAHIGDKLYNAANVSIYT